MREQLHSRQTKELFREKECDFSRTRKLTFPILIGLILRGHKFSLQNALNKVFSQLEEIFKVPTASAYSQAREKLQPAVFAHLNRIVREQFYTSEPETVRLWHGRRLLAADGTYLNLPDTAETRQEFFVQENQYKDGSCVQALAVVLYDVLNDLGVAGTLGRRQGEKKLLMREEIWESSNNGDVLVLDRGFADYALLAWLVSEGRDCVVRIPRRWMKLSNKFWESALAETVIELSCPASAREFVVSHHLAETLSIRLIRVELETGESEVLATTLLDEKHYQATEFKEVYGWRWREETYFSRLKGIFEIERFSGQSVHSIKQDFYAVLFLTSLEAILGHRDQQTLAGKSGKKKNGAYQINRSVSYLALVERVIELLFSTKDSAQVLSELHHLFQTNPLQPRAGRQNKRNKHLRYARKLRYHKYNKRIIA